MSDATFSDEDQVQLDKGCPTADQQRQLNELGCSFTVLLSPLELRISVMPKDGPRFTGLDRPKVADPRAWRDYVHEIWDTLILEARERKTNPCPDS